MRTCFVFLTNRPKGKSKSNSQLILERTISELNKKIKQISIDSQETELDIENIFKAKDRIDSKMQESKSKCNEFEQRERLLLTRLDDILNQKCVVTTLNVKLTISH